MNWLRYYGQNFLVDLRVTRKIIELSEIKSLEIINEDILKYGKPLEFDVFVSNIPFSKSKETLSWLATKKFRRAIIMVQDEFSQKIESKAGAKNYRAISAITQYCFDIEPLFKVDKNSFSPQPKVNSQVIKLIHKNKKLSKDMISKIHFLFSFKNKNINKLNKKLNTNFDQIDLKIKEIEPEKII